ncbi:hypothetical protein SRO_0133 [Streptomyces rochei]|nr:hypothetical protein SRO_0133 [Streptomyces rochei]
MFPALFARFGGDHLMSLMSQAQPDGLAYVWVILDKQNSWHLGSVGRCRRLTVRRRGPRAGAVTK